METLEPIGSHDLVKNDTTPETENLFKPLVPDARSTLRRLMLNSSNEKIARETAESILDRAGETKKESARSSINLQISDSQINILVQAAKEALDE